MSYLKIKPSMGLTSTVCLDDIKMVHITAAPEPHTSHKCIQIIYKDMSTITLFADEDLFADNLNTIYEMLIEKLPS
jgi:hypothetical protein